MEPALTNRIIHSHPAPGCTGREYQTEYTFTEWASGDIFTAFIRHRLDEGWTHREGDRIHVNPIAFYKRTLMIAPVTEGAAA
jgi:hypothetical protein